MKIELFHCGVQCLGMKKNAPYIQMSVRKNDI